MMSRCAPVEGSDHSSPGSQKRLSISAAPLSSWSAETFPVAQKRFEFLKWFQGVLLSGEVRLLKPDVAFFQLFLETFAVNPAQAVYIDDLRPNVEAAAALGMHGILFTDPPALRRELVSVGLIP